MVQLPRFLFVAALFGVCLSAQTYESLPNTAYNWWVYSYVVGNGQPIPNCPLTITTEFVANSNAHIDSHHPAQRPKSQLRLGSTFPWTNGPLYVQTNSLGYAQIQSLTPIIGQQEGLIGNPQMPGGIAQVHIVNVRYNDIYYVEEKPEWMHIGATTMHGGSNAYNHWMTTTAAYGIWYAAQALIAKNPSQGKIAVNDMSLPFGGKFDLAVNWAGSHVAHHRGTAVDVRANGAQWSLPSNKVTEFMQECANYGATTVLHESVGTSNEHVHCQWPNP